MGRTLARVASPKLPSFATSLWPRSLINLGPGWLVLPGVHYLAYVPALPDPLSCWLPDLREAENTAVHCHPSFCSTRSGPSPVAVPCGPREAHAQPVPQKKPALLRARLSALRGRTLHPAAHSAPAWFGFVCILTKRLEKESTFVYLLRDKNKQVWPPESTHSSGR